MNAIAFDIEKTKEIEISVCREFETNVAHVKCLKDTFYKKVVVFILFKYYGFNARFLDKTYKISRLYIPTVIEDIEYMIKVVPGFENRIKTILKQN
jgi:hypothetical protein